MSPLTASSSSPATAAASCAVRRKGGFSPQAAYIFKKQLEEADFVVINRTDELAAGGSG